MGQSGEQQYPKHVSVFVPRVMVSFRDEKGEDGESEPSEYVEENRKGIARITGEKEPGEVVDGHGDCRDDLQNRLIELRKGFHSCVCLLHSKLYKTR